MISPCAIFVRRSFDYHFPSVTDVDTFLLRLLNTLSLYGIERGGRMMVCMTVHVGDIGSHHIVHSEANIDGAVVGYRVEAELVNDSSMLLIGNDPREVVLICNITRHIDVDNILSENKQCLSFLVLQDDFVAKSNRVVQHLEERQPHNGCQFLFDKII